MRIFLIIDETNFYQPNYVASILRQSKGCHFIGCALVTKILPKSNIELYMLKNFHCLTLMEICKLCCKKTQFVFKDLFFKKTANGNFYSVKAVLRFFKINYFTVKNDINTTEYLTKIRNSRPDIILSSNSLKFGSELLSLAQHCINRHSALLPSYGGLWPILHALSNGETKVGVTVHRMTTRIDDGPVITQEEIIVEDHDTVDSLYQKCFVASTSVTLQAIKLIQEGSNAHEVNSKGTNISRSYFGFPTSWTWRKLREKNRRFI